MRFNISIAICLAGCMLFSDFSSAQQDANAFCHQCRDRRNQKDHYADATDCHFFYQCFFYNETVTIGYRRPCPPLTFWHDEILQCVPEGSIPCQDICRDNAAVATAGCYGVEGSCNQFFACSNTASYPFCCPSGSRFDASKCGCVTDDTCTAACVLPTRPPTTVDPPVLITEGECWDGFRNLLRVNPENPATYFAVDFDGNNVLMPCAPGTLFSRDNCRCDLTTDFIGNNANQCNLFLPLDKDLNDHSVYHHATFFYGDGGLDSITGGLTWFLNLKVDARMEIPGLKTIDFRNSASFCVIFQGSNGGLLSNNNDTQKTDYSTIIALQNSQLSGFTQFSNPNSETVVQNPNTVDNGWHPVCVVFDGVNVKLYVDAQLVDTKPAAGSLSIHHCPYTVGNDQTFGSFVGGINNVLICPFAFDQDAVTAHMNFDYSYFSNRGLIPAYP